MSFFIAFFTTCLDKPHKYVPEKNYFVPDCNTFENAIIEFFGYLDMFLEYYTLFYVNFIYVGQPLLYFFRLFLPEIKTANMKEPFNVIDCMLLDSNYKPCCWNNYLLYYIPLTKHKPSFGSCHWK